MPGRNIPGLCGAMKACPCLRLLDLQSSEERCIVCSGNQDLLGIRILRSKPEAKRSQQVYGKGRGIWSGDSSSNQRSEVGGLRVCEGRARSGRVRGWVTTEHMSKHWVNNFEARRELTLLRTGIHLSRTRLWQGCPVAVTIVWCPSVVLEQHGGEMWRP